MLNKFYTTAIETLINKYWAPIIGIFSLCSRHIFKDQTYYVKSLYFYHINMYVLWLYYVYLITFMFLSETQNLICSRFFFFNF